MNTNLLKTIAVAMFACFYLLQAHVVSADEENESKLNLLADSIAVQIEVIKDSARLYYIDNDAWPRSLSELKGLGYLPSDFEAKTEWGEEFALVLEEGQLAVDIKLPDADQLADIVQTVESFDAVSQAEKQLTDDQGFADDTYAKSSALVVERTDVLGEEAFNKKENTDDSHIVKSLTITNDEEFLGAARNNTIADSAPADYMRILISETNNRAEIVTDQDSISFNRGATVSGSLVVSKLLDSESSDFYVDPDKESSFADLKLNKIVDAADESFVLDPSEQSNLNQIDADTISADTIAVESLDVQLLNGSPPVNLGQLSGFAVTQLDAGSNINIATSGGQATSVVALVVGVIPDPEFNSLTVNNDATVGGNLNVSGDSVVEGDLSVDGNVQIDGSLTAQVLQDFSVSRDAVIGDSSADTLTINSTATFLSDLHLKNRSAITFIDEQTRIFPSQDLSSDGTTLIDVLNITSPDDITLAASAININAEEALNIQVQKVTISNDIDIEANVNISGNLSVFGGDVVLGSEDTKTTILSTIQGTTPLIFAGGEADGRYLLTLGDPTTDVELYLPNQSGDLLVLPPSGNLALPGDLIVGGAFSQTNSAQTNTFNSKVEIENSLEVTSGTNTPLTINRTGVGEFVSFSEDGGTTTFGLFGLSGSPLGTQSAGRGSLAIDLSQGQFYVNKDGSTDWARFVNEGESVVQGGNTFGETMKVGTLEEENLQFIVNGVPVLTLDTSGDATFAGSVAINETLDVTGDATFNDNVVLGDASTDRLTVNGVIQNDLVLAGVAGNTITLQRSGPTSNITLDLPSISGALVATDSTGDVSLPGNLTVANAITQSNGLSANTFEGNVVINNDLTVAATAETAATFSRTDEGEVLSFSVDGGTTTFGLYGLTSAPSGAVNIGSLAIDTSSGQLHIYESGTPSGWSRLITDGEAIVQGGNALSTTVIIGASDGEALSLITDGSERIGISSAGLVSVTGGLDVSGDASFASSVSIAQTLDVTVMLSLMAMWF